MVNLDF